MEKMYVITKKGKRVSGDISAKEDDHIRILRTLHEVSPHSMDVGDISVDARVSKGKAFRILKKLERDHLVDDLARI